MNTILSLPYLDKHEETLVKEMTQVFYKQRRSLAPTDEEGAHDPGQSGARGKLWQHMWSQEL